MSHEEKVAELYPVVGCCAKAARLILLSAKAIKNGPQALNAVRVCKYGVLPGKVRCSATLRGFPLETKFGIKRKTAFCCCSRGEVLRPNLPQGLASGAQQNAQTCCC